MTGSSLASCSRSNVLCCMLWGLVLCRVAQTHHPRPLSELGTCRGQVLAVTYDFSGAAARLVAVKVAGDNCIPPGRAVWTVLAAPEVHPHPVSHRRCLQWRTSQLMQSCNLCCAHQRARAAQTACQALSKLG